MQPRALAPSFPNEAFWRRRRVLLTGHTGFKGAWLALWLSELGAEIAAVALPPETTPNLYTEARICELLAHESLFDLSTPQGFEALSALITSFQPEICLHLAAQALVGRSYEAPLFTWMSNLIATLHLLEAVRRSYAAVACAPRVVVMVTTDKVYAPHSPQGYSAQTLAAAQKAFPYRETDPLGGSKDPYSASKAAAEIAIRSYREAWLAAFGIAVASARAGNVIGGGDWAADRLIPDLIRAWSQGQPITLRAPYATRPFQHVLEPLGGYLLLAERLWHEPQLADAYNFGPRPDEAARVEDVVELAAKLWGAPPIPPYQTASHAPYAEEIMLQLETTRARLLLGYRPRWGLQEGLRRTLSWYRAHAEGAEARALCQREIQAWMQQPFTGV